MRWCAGPARSERATGAGALQGTAMLGACCAAESAKDRPIQLMLWELVFVREH